MSHPSPHTPTDEAQSDTPNQANDEGELSLYKLQGMLHCLAMDLKPTLHGPRRDVGEALRFLDAKDPALARLVQRCMLLASDIVNVAADQLNGGIDWSTIEELYCPSDDDFQDTPEQWHLIGQAAAHRAQNGHTQNGQPQNGHAPAEALAAQPAPFALVPPPQEVPTAEMPPAPSQAALRRLGKSIRLDNEKEKRRFYAVARDTGLPTGENAKGAMFEALSKLFGETLTSHSQLDEIRWSKATSALHTRDLFWFAPPKRRGPSRGGPKPS